MKIGNFDLAPLKSFILPSLIVITIVLIIPFAFIPLLNNVKSTNNSLKEQQERLEKLDVKLKVLDSLDEVEINNNLALAEEALPIGKSLAPLIVGIQNLAAGSGLLVEGISLSPGKVATESASVSDSTQQQGKPAKNTSQQKSGGKKNKLILELNLKGKVAEVQDFLEKLQRGKRLSFADEVGITSEEKKDFIINISIHTPFKGVTRRQGDITADPLPELSATNLATLDLIEEFKTFTNIEITEVKTGVVKDPFAGK